MPNGIELKRLSENGGDPHASERNDGGVEECHQREEDGFKHTTLRSARMEIHRNSCNHVFSIVALAQEVGEKGNENRHAAEKICHTAFQDISAGCRIRKRP